MGGESDEVKRARRDERARQIETERRAEQESAVERQSVREKALRAEDLAAGRKRGEEVFGELEARTQEERTKDFLDVLERRREALGGLTAQQQTALESQALGGIARQQQTQQRQLRGLQAGAGVQGGLAAQQQLGLAQQAQQQAAEAQQNIFLANIGRQQEALGAFEQTAAAEQQRAQQTRAGQLGVEFGFAGLGAQERGGLRQIALGQQTAAAAQAAAEANEGKK